MQLDKFMVNGAISTKKQKPMTCKGFPKWSAGNEPWWFTLRDYKPNISGQTFSSSTYILITSMWANKVYRSIHPKIKSTHGAYNSNKYVSKRLNLNNMCVQWHMSEQQIMTHIFFKTMSFGVMLFLVILHDLGSPKFPINLASWAWSYQIF